MKQSISPAIIGIAVIVVVAIVALIGFKVFGPPASGDDAAYRAKMTKGGGQQMYSRDNPPPGSTVPPQGGPAGFSGYHPPAGSVPSKR